MDKREVERRVDVSGGNRFQVKDINDSWNVIVNVNVNVNVNVMPAYDYSSVVLIIDIVLI